MYTQIHYNYSIEVMRKKKLNEEKKKLRKTNFRIKIDIECVFFFLLNSKIKYTSQIPIVIHIIYKTHKSP